MPELVLWALMAQHSAVVGAKVFVRGPIDPQGCGLTISRPATLARWRAFEDGVEVRKLRGPWGPRQYFTCSYVGLDEETRTSADYILWDHDQGPTVCMPAAGSCP